MSRFVLTAQLQLQAPNNVRQVINQIQSQLGNGVNLNINLQNANQTQSSLQNINNQVNNLNRSGQQLGRTFGVAVRRFTAFAVATRAVSLFTNGLGNALEEAIDFQRELVKISQVTGKTTKQLDFLSRKITELSLSLGTSSSELLSTTRILAQAGIQAQDLEVALEALAKTSLAPTFENIEKTAEGAVAILAQFGQGVGALERQLGSINAVAGQFAVESGDLIATVRRTGGVFAAAGGDLEDLLGLFTSIRATTRESAESIATGLRTILTRIQRPKTIEFLKEFGVQLTDLNGKFVGPYEAVRRLSEAFSTLEEGDITFVRVAEELGGFRQIGKVIPLLQQFEVAERARQAAIDGGNSLTKDAATAQQALAVQIQRVREEFSALIRGIAETGTFQVLVKTSLNFASALIKIAGAIKPLLPLLATFAAVKITRNIAGFISGVGAGLRGGGVRGYASGGLVPGTGDRDTVPAMLTPGEFVIRKSSVEKLGVGTLAAMNQNKYAKGGKATMARIAEVDKSTAEITDGDTFKATVTPTGEPFDASFRLMGFDAYETGKKGSRVSPAEFERIKKIKQKDEDLQKSVEEASLTGSGGGAGYKIPYNSKVGRETAKSYADQGTDWLRKVVSGMSSEQLAQAVTDKGGSFGRYGIDLGIPEKTLRTGRYETDKATPQEFASGGRILDIKKAGAAILDPEEETSYTEKISTEDIKNQFGRAAKAKFARGKDPFSAKFSPTSVKVTTKGLNQETSDKFKTVLNESVVAGLDYAGSALATDLGVPPVAIDEATKQNFIASLRAAQIGDTYENILSTFNNKGVFDSSVDPNRPFDFPNGLTSPLADNFSGLPEAFIDAKSSSDAANEENIRGKILRQIQKELIDDGIYEYSPLFKAPKQRKYAKGGAAPSDTVPALLTPGEFVINKQAAQSIGYGTLKTMNDHGVTGFAAGGVVRTGRNNYGVTEARSIGDKPTTIKSKELENLSTASMKVGEALDRMGISVEDQKPILESFSARMQQGGKIFDILTDVFQEFGIKVSKVQKDIQPSPNPNPTPISPSTPTSPSNSNGPASPSNPIPSDAGLGPFAPGEPSGPGAQKNMAELAEIAQRTKNRFQGLISFGAGAVTALSGLQKSAEEVTKTNFAFGNALSQGVATFTTFQGILEQTKGWVESNITEDGEVQEGGSLDGFIKGLEGAGQKFTDIGARLQDAGKGSKIGGRTALGKVSSKLGGGLGKLGGVVNKAVNKIGPKLLKFVPFVGQFITAVTSVNSFLKAGFAAQEKYNKAVEDGNVAEAERYAVLKETTGITQGLSALFGDGAAEWEIGIKSYFGGSTLTSIKANAAAAALAAKANNDQAENSKRAAEVMEDVELGLITLEEAFTSGDITKNLANFNNALLAAQKAAEENNTNKSTGGGKALRNLVSFVSFGTIESGDARNDRIDSENEENIDKAKKARESEFNSLLPQFNTLAKQTIGSGQSFEDFIAIANKDGNLSDKEIEKLKKNFDSLAVQSKKTAAAIAALDLGLGPAKSAATGLSLTLGNLAATADGTGSALENSLNVIDAAASGANVNPEALSKAFDVATSAANEFVGGVDAQKIKQNITILNQALGNSTQAFENFKTGLRTDKISADPGKAADALINEFAKTLPQEMQSQFKAMFGDLKLTPEDIQAIMEGDYDAVYSKIAEAGGESFREFEAVMKPLVDAQNHMISVTRSRIKAEQEATQAALKNVELQEEAAKMIAEFSDRELTSQEKVGFINDRASAMGIDDTSASGLLNQVRGNNAQFGIYSATAGVESEDPMERAAREEGIANAQKSSQDAVTIARERVAVYREEIAMAKKRLEAEKKVAEALLAGDVEGFFDAAGASIAADAFRSGDVATLSQLSGKERAAGFSNLTDDEKKRSKPLLESLGMSSELADAAAGTSPEIQQLQKEASEYAQVLREAGDGPDKLAQASLRAAVALEKLADKALQEAKVEAEVRNQELEKRNEEKEAARKEAQEAEARQKALEKPYEDNVRKRAEESDVMLNYQEGTASYNDALEEQMDYIKKSDREMGIDYNNFGDGEAPRMSAAEAQRRADRGGTRAGGSMRSVEDGPGFWEGIRGVWNDEIDGGVHYGGGAHTDNYSMFKKNGGTIYASRGMFIPKGTDTVPAMLTPGEFVVNRSAVQRGNNLQILRAMNGGDTTSNGAPAPAAMAKGGSVRYYNQGGDVQQGAGGMGDFISGFGDAIGKLAGAFGTFAQSVETLSNMKLSVSLAPTSVDVNVMGPMLSELSEQTKEIVLNAVVSEIKLNQLGKLERTV